MKRLLTEVVRDEMVMRDRIAAILRDAPATIPTIADRLGSPSDEVVFWVMAMRRYGMIEEAGKVGPDGYFSYGLTEHGREGTFA